MRRTITLLVLLLCCTNTARAQASDGLPTEADAARDEYVNAVKKLSRVAVARKAMQKGEAKALNEDIVKKLGSLFRSDEDFASDAKLKEVAPELTAWKQTANDPSKHIPRKDLVVAIEEADKASGAYAAALEGESTGGRRGKEEGAATPSPTPAKPLTLQGVADDVAALQKQVGGQTGILPWWASLGLMTLVPLLAFGLLAFLFVSLHQARRDFDNANNQLRQGLLSIKAKHDGLSKQAEGLAASDADLFARLAELSAELGAVDGRVRGLKTAPAVTTEKADGDGRGIQPQPAPEPAAFPTSADAYLRKMQRHATVVKPDFQNGILVADSENRGELVLVQDTSISHDTLFVVPRAAQFQMKQDFYTYYERYYECERPTSGAVWIIDPAVVERVQGGWELREKGVLEVR